MSNRRPTSPNPTGPNPTGPNPTGPNPTGPNPPSARRGHRGLVAVTAAALALAGLCGGTGTALAAPSAQASVGAPAAAPVCDDGRWTTSGGSVEGTPAAFAAGAPGATYVWHDGGGWHLRTTDATPGPHHYSGTVAASPGARFVGTTKVRPEPGDQLWVDDHQVFRYDFTTYEHVDGVDFRVSACDGARAHETLTFALRGAGAGASPGAIEVGHDSHHPAGDPFTVTRSV